jgi:hypothetical protein
MWLYAADLGEWLTVRLLDAQLAGHDVPDSVTVVGILLIAAAAAALTALAVRAHYLRRLDRAHPAEDLLAEQPWLVDRGEREAMRKPSPLARRGGVYHGQPVEDVDTTVGMDVGTTAVIELVRPARYRGGRRG